MRVPRLNIVHHISRAACLCVLAACSSDAPTRYYAPATPVSEPQASDALIVLNFTMTEFRYASDPDTWYYAPQLRVVAAPGRTASLRALTFTMPGLGYSWVFTCSATLDSSGPRELFGAPNEEYSNMGVYAIRASGPDATVQISYVDDAGTTVTRALRGPITQGSTETYSFEATAHTCIRDG